MLTCLNKNMMQLYVISLIFSFFLLLNTGIADESYKCHKFYAINEPKFLKYYNLSFVAWREYKVGGLEWRIRIQNENGIFESSGLNQLNNFILPDPEKENDNSARLFVNSKNSVTLFYYNTENNISAVNYHVGFSTKLGKTEMSIQGKNLELNDVSQSGNYYNKILKFLVQQNDGVVEYKNCQYVTGSEKGNSKTCSSHKFPSYNEDVYFTHKDCSINEHYCLGDVAKEKDPAMIFDSEQKGPSAFGFQYHAISHCNIFQEIRLVKPVLELYKNNLHEITHFLYIYPNNSVDNKPLCIQMPPSLRFGFIWDNKWISGKGECQPISFVNAEVKNNHPENNCIEENPLASIPVFASTCLAAILFTLVAICMIIIERIGNKHRNHALKMKSHLKSEDLVNSGFSMIASVFQPSALLAPSDYQTRM